MRSTSLWIAGTAIVALVAAGGYFMSQQGGPGGTKGGGDFAVMATPPGITLQTISSGGGGRGAAPVVQTLYADARGMTLYTYDKDTEAGKSACTADCIATFPAAVAGNDAKPFGDWSVIARPDGTKQWAFKGKPLYSYVKDTEPGSLAGNSPKGAAAARGGPAGVPGGPKKPEEMPAGWHAASFQPAAGVTLPGGIALQEVVDAFGQVLVDEQGKTLYAFDGSPKDDKLTCIADTASCKDHWRPFPAAEIANPVGDFSTMARPDGSKQWAYKGQPLYTFTGDIIPGVAHGIGADKGWHPAMLVSYFTPPDIAVRQTLNFGDSLATSAGMTIYRRDAKPFQTSGHALPKNLTGIPTTGRVIGTAGCDTDCLKTWKPLLASAGAQASGYWELLPAPNGAKQWAYKGYALYTYAGDKKPGDMTGHDIYDLLINDNLQKTDYQPLSTALAPLIPNYAISLYWTYAAP